MITTNYLSVVEAHKLLIRANIHKLPDYYEHMYDSTEDELIDELNEYKREGMINAKYYDLLESVAKFININDLDISIVKKSTLNLINNYHKIRSLNKICFSKLEEISNKKVYESKTDNEISDNDSEISDDEHEISDNESEISYDEHEINNINTSKKPIITDKEHENDLRIILKQAIKNNDRELMISAMSLLKKFDENKSTTTAMIDTTTTTINNTAPTTNTETPYWLRPLKCTINPENNKKLCNQSFKYAIAASKTTGDKKFRLTKIEKHLNEFNFKNITYPPSINDYEMFKNNNPLIKLIIFKETKNEKELVFKYNDINKNDRPTKQFLIHLNSDHYDYVTKPSLLLRKYVKQID